MRDYKKIAAITMCVSVFGFGSYMAVSGIESAIDTMSGYMEYAGNETDSNSNSNADNSAVTDKNEVDKADEAKDDEAKVSLAKDTSAATASGYTDVSGVADSVLPSIVAINVEQTVQTNYFGRVYEQNSKGSGSGIIIKDEGDKLLIATNNHVVEDADSLSVEFADGESVEGRVRGTDANSDLAVVEVSKSDLKQSTIDSIAVIRVGSSEELKVGEMVVAIGNALGYGQSVTVGYVSAKDRKIDSEKESMALIQTDAAINPGNSGGALVNLQGELIGINSAKFASEEIEGMGFAIPITDAGKILEQLSEMKASDSDRSDNERSSADNRPSYEQWMPEENGKPEGNERSEGQGMSEGNQMPEGNLGGWF